MREGVSGPPCQDGVLRCTSGVLRAPGSHSLQYRTLASPGRPRRFCPIPEECALHCRGRRASPLLPPGPLLGLLGPVVCARDSTGIPRFVRTEKCAALPTSLLESTSLIRPGATPAARPAPRSAEPLWSALPDLGQSGSTGRADMLTEIAPVSHESGAPCPEFIRFLSHVLPDEEIREFVRRALGYSFSGTSRSSVVSICQTSLGPSPRIPILGPVISHTGTPPPPILGESISGSSRLGRAPSPAPLTINGQSIPP